MLDSRREINSIIKLAIPVFIAQLAQTSMGFVDTVMAGGVSTTDMAAVAVASSVWFPAILFGIGILMAMVPIISQMHGSGRQEKVPMQIQQGIYLALLLAVPIGLILYHSDFILNMMDLEPALREKT
ncbi:MAG: MATE family efflux transporter, partial [Vibrionaceae bacterium]